MLISEEYRKLNEDLHDTNKPYGSSGHKWAKHILGLSQHLGTRDIIDYGCGKSTLALNLPFDIKQYDPAIEKYKEKPEPADILVCTDVLEHIEPECIVDVLNDIHSLTKKIAFLVIHNGPAKKVLADGRNAHLIQENEAWWLTMLFPKFQLQQFSCLMGDNHTDENSVLEYIIAVTPL